MISSTFKATGCLLFAICISIYAQNPAKKPATSTISGKVTLKGSGIAGISVGARQKDPVRSPKTTLKATTDSQGNYRISNVPPGIYEVLPGSPQFVLPGSHWIKPLIVGEGETLDGVDFALVRGGVITGRVTDSEGRPVVEENVTVSDPKGTTSEPFVRFTPFFAPTDDRGIYRFYGLPPGKYTVSAGMREEDLHYGHGRQNKYKQTFHPSTIDSTRATLVEVTEGGEATNVDITLRRAQAVFTVTGKVVDAETGRPLSNIVYGLQKFHENSSTSSSGMSTTKAGEFKFDNVTPGKYSVFIQRSPELDRYAEPVPFEVTDQDVTGLVIKASSGNTISGVIVFEGVDEKTARMLLNGTSIWAHSTDADERSRAFRSMANASADGSFRMSAMQPGVVEFSVFAGSSGTQTECEITRIEHNGLVQNDAIEVKDHEHLSGLRLFAQCHGGGLRGVVKIENAELVAKESVSVFVSRVGDNKFQTSVQLDARGRFSLDGLKAGVYEILAIAYVQGFGNKAPSVKQQVAVSENQVSEVTLTLDLIKKDQQD